MEDNSIIPNHKFGSKTIWEPACGKCGMSNMIAAYHHKVISSDIEQYVNDYGPSGDSGVDFLDEKTDYGLVDAIITNPPFNKSQLFIERAIKIAPIVAMLLKSQYWHSKSRYNLFVKYPPAYILPLTWRPDFLEHERKVGEKKGSPTMEMIWTIWIDGQTNTRYIPLPKPPTK